MQLPKHIVGPVYCFKHCFNCKQNMISFLSKIPNPAYRKVYTTKDSKLKKVRLFTARSIKD